MERNNKLRDIFARTLPKRFYVKRIKRGKTREKREKEEKKQEKLERECRVS